MTSTGRQWLTFPWWFREALQREWHVIWVFRIIRSSDGGSREDISGFRGMKLRHEAQQQILSNTGLCWALRGRKVAKWWRKWFKAIVLIGLKPAKFFCYAQRPNPRAGRGKASKTMQLAKREVYYWLESGLLPHPMQWCGVREPRAQAVTQIYRVCISSW